METRRRIALAVGLVVVALGATGCLEGPAESTDADRVAAPATTFDGRVVQSVTGSAHLFGGAIERTLTFDIRKYADGTVDGWYHMLARGPGGAHVRVRIDCLHVVGNQAWATGTVVAAEGEGNIGRPYALRVIDHGEGGNDVPDEVGVVRFVEYDCTAEPELSLRPVVIGNIQVRG